MLSKIKRSILTFKELNGLPNSISFLKKTGLNSFAPLPAKIIDTIKQKHQEYVTTVSSPEMAISLESSLLLYQLAITVKPKFVLDLGAGFSSFVFRLASKNSSGFIVYSVDDDLNWLTKTKNYLTQNELTLDNLIGIDDFKKLNNVDFDIVLLDLNFVEVRINYIETVIDKTRKNGIIIFDDTHKIEYLRAVKETCFKNNVTLFNFKNLTLDSYNRFALIGLK